MEKKIVIGILVLFFAFSFISAASNELVVNAKAGGTEKVLKLAFLDKTNNGLDAYDFFNLPSIKDNREFYSSVAGKKLIVDTRPLLRKQQFNLTYMGGKELLNLYFNIPSGISLTIKFYGGDSTYTKLVSSSNFSGSAVSEVVNRFPVALNYAGYFNLEMTNNNIPDNEAPEIKFYYDVNGKFKAEAFDDSGKVSFNNYSLCSNSFLGYCFGPYLRYDAVDAFGNKVSAYLKYSPTGVYNRHLLYAVYYTENKVLTKYSFPVNAELYYSNKTNITTLTKVPMGKGYDAYKVLYAPSILTNYNYYAVNSSNFNVAGTYKNVSKGAFKEVKIVTFDGVLKATGMDGIQWQKI